MRIAITGATGLIGRRLADFFASQGCAVTVFVRNHAYQKPGVSVAVWDPSLSYIEIEDLEGFDVIIHLAGADIARRWTPEQKKNILDSRVVSTRLLCESLTQAASKPKLVLCASAIGFYGSHSPQDVVDENSPRGRGFLADVCRQWEAQTEILASSGIRTVLMRFGVVLSNTGGALAKMKVPFQMGIGGVLGSGQQMMSWVALEEIPHIVDHLIKQTQISGPVNVVSPQAVSNRQLTIALGEVMHRATVLPVPAFAVRMLFGEMGQSLLLEGAHVAPRRLQESGYNFRFPDLKSALKEVAS